MSNNSNQCVSLFAHMRDDRKPPDWTTRYEVVVFAVTSYSVLFVLGVITNAALLFIILCNKTLRTVTNIYLANLFVSHILLAFTSLPLTAYSYLYKSWAFGGILCKAMPQFAGMPLIVTAFSLTAIAVDRYMMVVRKRVSPGRMNFAVGSVLGIWVLAGAVCAPVTAHTRITHGYEFIPVYCESFCAEADWNPRSTRLAYGGILFFAQYVLPCLVIVGCYVRIMRVVNSRRVLHHASEQLALCQAVSQRLAPNSKQRRLRETRTKRTNLMIVLMSLTFTICWFPLVAINTAIDYQILPKVIFDQYYFYALVSHLLAMSSVVINALLYGVMNTAFREVMRRPKTGKNSVSYTRKYSLSTSLRGAYSKLRKQSTATFYAIPDDVVDELV